MKTLIQVTSGPHQGDSFEVDPTQEVWIGRAADIAIRLDRDPSIAPRHCRIVLAPEGLRLYPGADAGPLFVNGARIEESPLVPGDTLALGGSVLRLAAPGSPRLAETVHIEGGDPYCESCGLRLTVADRLENISKLAGSTGSTGRTGRTEICPACRRASDPLASSSSSSMELPRVVDDPFLGREFGVYRIESFAGEGMTGRVYRARHRYLKEVRAIKVLKDELAANEKMVRRFFQGAQAAARLSHPNIIKVFDANQIDGRFFVAMEYVRGVTLEEAIRVKGRLPWPVVRAIADSLLAGLDHAYSRHVVHRDLKPANIVLARGGVLKISDFGLAKNLKSSTESLTKEAEIFGTLPYLPPEQIRGARNADHQSDLYSLGATLYHALAGTRPFELAGEPVSGMLARVYAEEPADLGLLAGHVPESARDLVRRLMAKDRELRYATPADARDDLAEIPG